MTTDSNEALTTSVIVPSHERPELVRRALKSVEQQTELPEEIIVVNDGSEADYSPVESHLESFPTETRYIRTDGVGAAAARNIGADQATGNLYMFLDDDDRWLPRKVEDQQTMVRDRPNVGLVYAGRKVVDSNGQELYSITPSKRGDLSRKLLVKNVVGITSSVAIRRETFERVGGFDEVLPARQDYDLWIRIAQVASIDYVAHPLVEWTIPEAGRNSISADPERYRRANSMLLEKHGERIRELSFVDQRRSMAATYANIAAKYHQNGSASRFRFALRSLLYWPTLSALSKLPPETVTRSVRNLLRI